jgi:hypothetical protein
VKFCLIFCALMAQRHAVISEPSVRIYMESDEVATIDFAHMTEAVRSMLKPVLWLANSPQKPQWKPGMQPQ